MAPLTPNLNYCLHANAFLCKTSNTAAYKLEKSCRQHGCQRAIIFLRALARFNIDLLKINNNATLGNYFNSVVAQSFFPLITLPTRFSDHNCTLIDNFLCKLNRSYLPSTSGILVSRISDHFPYFTFFNLLTSKRNEPSKSVKIQNLECGMHSPFPN